MELWLRSCILSRALVLLVAWQLQTASATAAPTEIAFGNFVITVSDSWSAQVFHIVDQMAQWDDSSHGAYGRWAKKNLNLNAEDQQLLQKHGEMRRARGWGNGFEQAFLTEGSIEAAAARAVSEKLVSPEEAESEKAILLHFAPKLVPLREQHQQQIEAFKAKLVAEQKRLSPWFDKLIRFTETKTVTRAPVFLVVNSEETSGGGEGNSNRIIVEVPGPDSMGVLLHESLHVLLSQHLSQIQAAGEAAGIRWQDLNDGIVYALAPGLTDDPKERDGLAEQVGRFVIRGTPASNSYVQINLIAIVIRPVLRTSIDAGETLPVFLPKAVAKWKAYIKR